MKTGILLVNLGTPEAPTPKAVKAFLSQFLHDHRVVDMSRWLWCPLLHGIILPRRSPKVAQLYKSIWMEDGSPLMVYSKSQTEQLQSKFSEPVELAMTYGQPSIPSAINTLVTKGVEQIIVLPLYPQYSGTTTGAVEDALARALKSKEVKSSNLNKQPNITIISNYHDYPLYIKALANKVRDYWHQHGKGDYLLCSYHGIPQRYADNGDIYPTHCQITTTLLAKELGLSSDSIGFSYQSRFGKEEWVKPYTDETLVKLAKNGVERLDIITPAFSSDCLETLEEIAVECQSIFTQAGGKAFSYIPCLNDDKAHIEMMAELVKEKLYQFH